MGLILRPFIVECSGDGCSGTQMLQLFIASVFWGLKEEIYLADTQTIHKYYKNHL